MRKLLVVAYHFPPFREVGGFRVRKLVKYFNKFGWDITVMTVRENFYGENEIDMITFEDIPETVKIVRTNRLKQLTRYKNPGIYWIKDLFINLRKLVNRDQYDYIFYTGNPFSHWVVAPWIKKISGIPYILDYRDPWLLSPYGKKRNKMLAKLLEPTIVKNADYILNVTPEATSLYKRYYSTIPESKFITITNGYDEDDFIDIQQMNLQKNGIKIVYSGKFDTFRNPEPFLAALQTHNMTNEKKLYFIHLGKRESAIKKFLEENQMMKNYIIETGYVPYKEALAYIKACDIGLIITGGHAYEPTTKVYDYIALDKLILSINDNTDGYMQKLLNSYNNSLSVSNNKKAILNSFSELEKINTIGINKDMFNRENIFLNLERILKENL